MKGLVVFGFVLLLLMVVAAAVWWSFYKYQDCLKVGHSTLYCIGRLIEGG